MGILGWLFGGNRRNKKIAEWAKTVQYNTNQRSVMHELWYAAALKQPLQIDPVSRLSPEELAYLIKICGADFRPRQFGSCNVLRLSAFEYFIKERGYTSDQAAILVGMMFNMVGRPDL